MLGCRSMDWCFSAADVILLGKRVVRGAASGSNTYAVRILYIGASTLTGRRTARFSGSG